MSIKYKRGNTELLPTNPKLVPISWYPEGGVYMVYFRVDRILLKVRYTINI